MSSSLIILLPIFLLVWIQHCISSAMAACKSPIYCEGPLLDLVQKNRLYNDSKTFVDMPLRSSPEVVVQEFDKLRLKGNISKAELQTFVDNYFLPPGHELEEVHLTDWNESPSLLAGIKDGNYSAWASSLNKLWKTLARKVKDDVRDHPDRHSLLYAPNPFITPGDRFREFYYWDTYWIVKGLLTVNMTTTVKGILENFLYILKEHGMIPNGGRIYYLNRSQPPLLTPMVEQYFKATNDIAFIRDNIALMEQEYQWWMENRVTEVSINGTDYKLNRYSAQIDQPRPEGYREDLELVNGQSQEKTSDILSSVASACESGLDFSSRWFQFDSEGQPGGLETIKTRHIAPVDLNVFLGMNEEILASFFKELGDDEKHQQYQTAFDKRLDTVNTVFWDANKNIWFDLDLDTKELRSEFYPSNIYPLMMYHNKNETEEGLQKLTDVITYLKKEKVLDYPGGIPSSKINTGQQWDLASVWSPQISLIIQSLNGFTSSTARQMTFRIAKNWIQSNYKAWKKYGQMFEKYDAEKMGEPGSGGEYTVQVGFGWTNGVVLSLLNQYGNIFLVPDIPSEHVHHSRSTFIYVFITIVCGIVVFVACLIFCQMEQIKRRRQGFQVI